MFSCQIADVELRCAALTETGSWIREDGRALGYNTTLLWGYSNHYMVLTFASETNLIAACFAGLLCATERSQLCFCFRSPSLIACASYSTCSEATKAS